MNDNAIKVIAHPSEKKKERFDLIAESQNADVHRVAPVVTKTPYSNLSRDLPLIPVHLGSCEAATFIRTKRGLGDMVSLLGAISSFREKHPTIQTTLLGVDPVASIALHHPAVDKVITSPRLLDLDSKIFDLSTPGPCSVIEGYFRSPEPGNRSLLFAVAIGLEKTNKPQVMVTPEERLWAKDWFAKRRLSKPVGVVYKTASKTKNFVAMPELFQRVQWDFDAYLIEHANPFLSAEPTTIGLTIRQQAALIAESKAVITPDTGWLHVAGGLQVPLVGLFGSYPAQQTMSIYKVPTLAVAGYCPLGQQPCRAKIYCQYDATYKHPHCLSQSVDEVYPQIAAFLERYAN
jgi:hypothetical protein